MAVGSVGFLTVVRNRKRFAQRPPVLPRCRWDVWLPSDPTHRSSDVPLLSCPNLFRDLSRWLAGATLLRTFDGARRGLGGLLAGEARLERLHEVGHRCAALLAWQLELFAFDLGLDSLAEHFGVGVAELLGLPFVGECIDESVGEIHLFLRPALTGFREVEVVG
jgi:hypothetical protein